MADTEGLVRMIDEKTKEVLSNRYAAAGVTFALALYGVVAAPKLPRFVCEMYRQPLVRLAIVFMIAYLSSLDFSAALVATLVFFIVIHRTLTYDFNDVMKGTACDAYITREKPKDVAPAAQTLAASFMDAKPSMVVPSTMAPPTPMMVPPTPMMVDAPRA